MNYYINATDDTSKVSCFVVNDTNFNINCSGYLKNVTAMGVGIRWLNITINDTLNNLNSTIMFVNVTQATPTLTYSINSQTNNISIVYPQQVNASATTNAGTLYIYRNSVQMLQAKMV